MRRFKLETYQKLLKIMEERGFESIKVTDERAEPNETIELTKNEILMLINTQNEEVTDES